METLKQNRTAKRKVSELLGKIHLKEPNYIKVDVLGETLRLSGYVQSWTDRDNIEDVISNIAGIKSIINNLEIRTIPPTNV